MGATQPGARTVLPPWTGAVSVGAGALAGCAVVLVADPRSSGVYPLCPFLAATGQWCPLCGGLRAVRSVLDGDLAAAVGYHAPLVLALPVVLYVWVAWLTSATRRGPRLPVPVGRRRTASLVAAASLLAAFALLRNLAPFASLAPGT